MAPADVPVLFARRRFPRFLVYLLAILLLAGLGTAGWLYSIAEAALPQLDGEIKVTGLTGPVRIVRDGRGVPTIEAGSYGDLFFAQGFVTAQDRLWQMDILRRAAGGDLAEIVGPEALEHDRQQRILGLRLAAQKTIEIASPEIKAHYEAYARGVNAYIQLHRNRLPLEFRILRYSPRPWTPEDSTLIAAQMVQNLSRSPKVALVREKFLAKLGPELTADLYVNTSMHDRPPTVMRQQKPDLDDDSGANSSMANRAEHGSAPTRRLSVFRADFFADDGPRAIGSNNWVVSGAHTVSGKPLLSNDMHLGHQMPNLWYEANLRCADFDVAGVTLPGIPYVIVGHNRRIAWGFTNIGPTVEDLYVETFNPAGQYLTPEGWKTPGHRREVIHVKGKPNVVLDVESTRHGPIVTSLVPGETRELALRWTLYDGLHNPFFALDSAQNWEQFRKALWAFDAPGQNVVYADVDGNIGYQATGKVPIRASGDGSLPEVGSDDQHEWTGYIPFEKLPSVLNPASGILATANSRITPDGYPNSISGEWEAPWRTERICRVLESGRKFSAADMLALEMDVNSAFDHFVAERFAAAVGRAGKVSTRAKQAADLMRQWDGRMTADSAAATIETQARGELVRLLLEPKLGTAPEHSKDEDGSLSWKSYRWGMQSVWLENVLLNKPKRWLPTAYSNYDELMVAAVEAAVGARGAPNGLGAWRWGKVNPVEIQHPILGRIPFLGRWTGPGVHPQSGSAFTVKAVTRSHGPSERMTVDFSNLDGSTLNLVTGEAGNLLSPYYMDQWKAWYEGSTFALPFSKDAVEKQRAHALRIDSSF